MARYRLVIFYATHENDSRFNVLDGNVIDQVDGFIYDDELVSLDTIRWMLPEMSDQKQKETFHKILMQKIQQASEQGLSPLLINVVR